MPAFVPFLPLARPPFLPPRLSPPRRARTPVLALRAPPAARLRDPGGFALPPRIPSHPPALVRALDLLGAATQSRRASPSVRAELAALIGAYPPSREAAQAWKGALRLRARRLARAAAPRRAPARPAVAETAFMRRVALPPTDARLSRAFVVLEILRWNFDAGATPNGALLDEVEASVGVRPRGGGEVFAVKNALIRHARARKTAERRPPRVPEGADLVRANMLLGQRGVERGGERGRVLEEIVGARPRTSNIANSWQKQVQYVLRRRARKQRVERDAREADEKRAQRRAKRERLHAAVN